MISKGLVEEDHRGRSGPLRTMKFIPWVSADHMAHMLM